MKFKEVRASDIPIEILLVADPSESNIKSYLLNSWCYAAYDKNSQVIAACVVKKKNEQTAELFNISVNEAMHAKGIGSKLLKFTIENVATKGVRRIELGTGTFGYQLTFYQRFGFRVSSIVKNHFLTHYPEEIYENGIQHKDMLRLYLNL